jgi:hypothetical protein
MTDDEEADNTLEEWGRRARALQERFNRAGLGDPKAAEIQQLKRTVAWNQRYIREVEGELAKLRDIISSDDSLDKAIWKERNLRMEREIESLRDQLATRGPYCSLHGQLQPCREHRWVPPKEDG